MTDGAVRRHLETLRAAIRTHDYRYYVLDRPTISDQAYDRLFTRLVRLEAAHPDLVTPDSPTQRVAGAPLAAFPAIAHVAPMLSLESVTDAEAVRRFDARIRERLHTHPRYVLEPKFDGLSLEIVYRDGVLDRASTRGDGEHGEGVTENVKTIRSVPLRLHGRGVPRLLAVRGEAMMRIADFDDLNRQLERRGEPPFANPRNAAAGSIRQLDPRVTGSRRLDVLFYDVLRIDGRDRFTTDIDALAALSAWGLHTSPFVRSCRDVDDVFRYHNEMERRRASLPYEIDGVVLKVDALALRRQFGTTARHPRWAIAFKFAPRAAETTIERIVVQVGRTGVLTPVAVLAPASIGGVTVTRATLHNRVDIARKDLRVGDRVRVVRAGDVIPDVVERVADGRRTRGKPFVMPRRCPVCRSAVVRDGPFYRCPNGLACPAQLKRTIRHFAASLDIRGLGPETIDALVSHGLVRSVADLFALTRADLLRVERFASTSADNLVRAIAAARRVPLWRFLLALGIPGVGAQGARDLATDFGTLRRLLGASEQTIARAPGIGPAVGSDVAAFFRRADNRRVVDECRRRGVRLIERIPEAHGVLAGKTVVFTGGLASMSREAAEERARANGAQTARSVSGRTDLVIAGSEPGAKYARARALGIRILDEAEFRRLTGTHG